MWIRKLEVLINEHNAKGGEASYVKTVLSQIRLSYHSKEARSTFSYPSKTVLWHVDRSWKCPPWLIMEYARVTIPGGITTVAHHGNISIDCQIYISGCMFHGRFHEMSHCTYSIICHTLSITCHIKHCASQHTACIGQQTACRTIHLACCLWHI